MQITAGSDQQLVLRGLIPEIPNHVKAAADQIFLQHLIFNDREQVIGSQGLGVQGVLEKVSTQNFVLRWVRYVKQ